MRGRKRLQRLRRWRQEQQVLTLNKLRGRDWCALNLDATKNQVEMAVATVMPMANARGVRIRTARTMPKRRAFA